MVLELHIQRISFPRFALFYDRMFAARRSQSIIGWLLFSCQDCKFYLCIFCFTLLTTFYTRLVARSLILRLMWVFLRNSCWLLSLFKWFVFPVPFTVIFILIVFVGFLRRRTLFWFGFLLFLCAILLWNIQVVCRFYQFRLWTLSFNNYNFLLCRFLFHEPRFIIKDFLLCSFLFHTPPFNIKNFNFDEIIKDWLRVLKVNFTEILKTAFFSRNNAFILRFIWNTD